MLKELIRISNELDRRGLVRLASQLDDIILETASKGANEASGIVADAIDRSIGMPHFKNTFLTRNPGGEAEGSTFFEPQSAESLKAAVWAPYSHPDIAGAVQGYKADIPGTFGLVELGDLDPNTPVKMVLGHKGETPFVTCLISKDDAPGDLQRKDFTTILLGPGDEGLIVYTFFPGPPIAPSRLQPTKETEAARVVADAISLDFRYGKIATL